MAMTLTIEAPNVIPLVQKRTRKIPHYLVYEVIDGNPIYYQGYKIENQSINYDSF
jgi:hypothetical protein